MDKKLEIFFLLYADFLKIDALSSLTDKGRNRNIINQYLKLFSQIINKSDNFNDTVRYIAKMQLAYHKENEHLVLSNIYNAKLHTGLIKNYQTKQQEIFEIFYRSAKLYHIHRKNLSDNEARKIYLKNSKDYFNKSFKDTNLNDFNTSLNNYIKDINPIKEGVLKQSLMEFNNALSHIYNALIARYTEENIHRAITHLQRASLDFCKAIVKDIFYLQKIGNNEIEDIKTIRQQEYKKIGEKDSSKRYEIIENYHNFIQKNLITKEEFDKEKQKILGV